jgi:hypothetical protein
MLADIEVEVFLKSSMWSLILASLQAGLLQPQLLVQRTIALSQVAAAMEAMSISSMQQAAGVTIIDPWAE